MTKAVQTEGLTDFPNITVIYYASVYLSDERRGPPSLLEPSAIINAPHLTEVAVHKALSTCGTAKGPCSDQILPDF